MNQRKCINNSITYYICLTSFIMGLTLSSYYISNSFPLGVIGSLDIHFLFYIFGIILIKNKSFKIFFFFSIPFLSIFNVNILAINYIQVFVEYFLVYYCFFLFLFFNSIIKEKRKIIAYTTFIILIILSFSLRLMMHVISGIIWWGAPNILISFLINIRMLIMDWIFTIPIMIVTFKYILNFYEKK